MKKLILSAAILLGSLSTFAQDAPQEGTATEAATTTKAAAPATDTYAEVKTADLPSGIAESLKKSHPDAVISKAYANENKQFKLDLVTGDKTETIITDANGAISEK